MAKFNSTCEIVARLHGPLNLDEWKDVNINTKKIMWDELQKYLYPPGSEDIEKKFALSTMAHWWRQWKSDMNTYYVQKNKSPLQEYRNITPTEWNKFVAKMTTPAALARRKKMSDLAKKNKYPHRLGSSGYDGHVDQWRAMEENTGQVTDEGEMLFETPEIEHVTTSLQQIDEKKKTGEFVARREHDEFTAALGTAEHSGRIRRQSSRTSWKEGFLKESKSYKKRDAYKAKLREEGTEQVTQQVTQQFYRLAAQNPQAFPNLVPQPKQTVQIPSSVGSVEKTPYPVDLITSPTTCSLIVLIGRAEKTKEVGSGLAILGRSFHNNPIPKDYARVQVARVNADQMSLELDIPTPEGIELLGDAVNQFILWHRGDIILTGQPTLTTPAPAMPQTAAPPAPPSPSNSPTPPRSPIPPRSPTHQDLRPQKEYLLHRQSQPRQIPHLHYLNSRLLLISRLLLHNLPSCNLCHLLGKMYLSKSQSWDSTEVPKEYEYGKPFLPFNLMLELPWPMRLLSQWVDAQRTGASIGYANPTRVCMTALTVKLNLDGQELKDKALEEREAYVDKLHKKKQVEVATYLGQAMLTHADKRLLMVPYHLTDHYILFLIYPRDHIVVVLDPAHCEESAFMEILVLVNLGHDYYKRHGGYVKDQKRKKLLVKCYKQPLGTNLCRYYVCEMLRVNGRYRTEFTDFQSILYTANRFDRRMLLNLCADLCRFIRRDICNHLGEFYDDDRELAWDDKFKSLREWEREHMVD
uniref:DUF8039 domain-containing protein n=1 Tax=Oryza meridionalis TaxID=40149 RepID=A0A0E0DKP6_9ORYZ